MAVGRPHPGIVIGNRGFHTACGSDTGIAALPGARPVGIIRVRSERSLYRNTRGTTHSRKGGRLPASTEKPRNHIGPRSKTGIQACRLGGTLQNGQVSENWADIPLGQIGSGRWQVGTPRRPACPASRSATASNWATRPIRLPFVARGSGSNQIRVRLQVRSAPRRVAAVSPMIRWVLPPERCRRARANQVPALVRPLPWASLRRPGQPPRP